MMQFLFKEAGERFLEKVKIPGLRRDVGWDWLASAVLHSTSASATIPSDDNVPEGSLRDLTRCFLQSLMAFSQVLMVRSEETQG